MSEQVLVRCCSPTLAGLKTGSLFSCSYESEAQLSESLRELNRRLWRKGLCVLALRRRAQKALIYVYRPKLLQRDLKRPSSARLLEAQGYPDRSPGSCLRHLMQRLAVSGAFPHEIGLFLGYPPEDVCGFMNDSRACKCCGCWKVYGDEEAARACFERFDRCTKTYCERYDRGMSLESLAVTV